MFTKEKQELITSKNWDKLSQTDIFCDFGFDLDTCNGYVFEKEFLTDFIFDDNYFERTKKYVNDELGKVFYVDMLFSNILFRSNALSIVLSTEEWKKIITFLHSSVTSHLINSRDAIYFFTLTGKDINFFRACLDDNTSKKIKSIERQKIRITQTLDANEFRKLSPTEQQKVIYTLPIDCFSILEIKNGDGSVFENIADSPNEVEILSKFIGIPVSEIYKNLSPDKYYEKLKELVKSGIKPYVYRWCNYFRKHPEFVLTQEQFEFFLESFNTSVISTIILNISIDMLKSNFRKIAPISLLLRPEITLDDMTELYGKQRMDLTGVRFFTEEEIVKNPHFFDPNKLNDSTTLYCSKETFKLLNKTWGTKHKYNTNLTDCRSIVRKLNDETLSAKALKYIKRKTGSSNDIMLTAIMGILKSNLELGAKYNDDAAKILKIREFLTKFA